MSRLPVGGHDHREIGRFRLACGSAVEQESGAVRRCLGVGSFGHRAVSGLAGSVDHLGQRALRCEQGVGDLAHVDRVVGEDPLHQYTDDRAEH